MQLLPTVSATPDVSQAESTQVDAQHSFVDAAASVTSGNEGGMDDKQTFAAALAFVVDERSLEQQSLEHAELSNTLPASSPDTGDRAVGAQVTVPLLAAAMTHAEGAVSAAAADELAQPFALTASTSKINAAAFVGAELRSDLTGGSIAGFSVNQHGLAGGASPAAAAAVSEFTLFPAGLLNNNSAAKQANEFTALKASSAPASVAVASELSAVAPGSQSVRVTLAQQAMSGVGKLEQAISLSDRPAAGAELLQEKAVAGDAAVMENRLNQLHSMGSGAAKSSLNLSFSAPRWNEALGQQVVQLAAKNLNFAEIQLDPPELGPLQVRVQLQHDQAAVSFSAQSSAVREQLEQGQARLREIFAAEGFDLVDVDVKDQRQQRDDLDSEQGAEQAADQLVDATDDEDQAQSVSMQLKLGVDDFV
ncbi:flagellar hook-length control protein FliK [Agaribacterium haliotis]|uniref:flagellar hook-length control protein FliK n=1 Tax=Agaribacterium haliotis TaxID=2013869 RepID=UPI000BB59350|nr:flagellar hook-length control protein FliK [Agaribacterium haliotis]